MTDAIFHSPAAINETVQSYAPGTKEREQVLAEYDRMMKQKRELPMWIGGKAVETKDRRAARPPHQHKHILGYSHHGDKGHVKLAINAALKARKEWESMPLGGPRRHLPEGRRPDRGPYRASDQCRHHAGQGKNCYQAEIDAASEFATSCASTCLRAADLPRPTHQCARHLEPLEYRALEGFVFALTPFNFTAIAGNLPASCALMGNTVVWKCADTQVLQRAGDHGDLQRGRSAGGVINLIHVDGPAGEVIFKHKDFAGIHFTGSTKVFRHIWQTIGNNLPQLPQLPAHRGRDRRQGLRDRAPQRRPESGGHRAQPWRLRVPGAEVQRRQPGLHPRNIWPAVKKELLADLAEHEDGRPARHSRTSSAVIDEKSFDKIAGTSMA
jgi:1-pyrroline-5-carboxylate dehydrogenase